MAHKALMMIQSSFLDSNAPLWPVGSHPGPRAPSSRPLSRAGILDIEGDSKGFIWVLRPVQSSTISAVGAFSITEAIPFLQLVFVVYPSPDHEFISFHKSLYSKSSSFEFFLIFSSSHSLNSRNLSTYSIFPSSNSIFTE